MCSTSGSYPIIMYCTCLYWHLWVFPHLNKRMQFFFYKRTHSLQNYQRNSLLRLSYQFVSAIFFGNKTHKRSKDTLHPESPLSFLVYVMSLFSSTIQDCIYCSHGDFHAWARLWFLVSIMCSWTIFQLCLCGLMIYKFLTFCTAYFLSHAL